MSKKDAREYERHRREEISRAARRQLDEPMLELMGRLRHYTHQSDAGQDPRIVALRDLRAAIDNLGAVVTGDPEYFHTKGHSIGG